MEHMCGHLWQRQSFLCVLLKENYWWEKRSQLLSGYITNLEKWSDDIIKFIHIGNKNNFLYWAYSMILAIYPGMQVMCGDHLWLPLASLNWHFIIFKLSDRYLMVSTLMISHQQLWTVYALFHRLIKMFVLL